MGAPVAPQLPIGAAPDPVSHVFATPFPHSGAVDLGDRAMTANATILMLRLVAAGSLLAISLGVQGCVGTIAAGAIGATGKVAGATVGAAGHVAGSAMGAGHSRRE